MSSSTIPANDKILPGCAVKQKPIDYFLEDNYFNFICQTISCPWRDFKSYIQHTTLYKKNKKFMKVSFIQAAVLLSLTKT